MGAYGKKLLNVKNADILHDGLWIREVLDGNKSENEAYKGGIQ